MISLKINKDKLKSNAGLEAVAVFEASKGLLVLLVGIGLLSHLGSDIQHVAEDLVQFFRLNPAHRYPRIFIETVSRFNNIHLWLLSLSAFFYSIIRFIEAYGIWNNRLWAEWFAVVSCGLYIPLEIYELIQKVTFPRMAVTFFNAALILFLLYIVRKNKKKTG